MMKKENFNAEVKKLVGCAHPNLEHIFHIWHASNLSQVVLFCEKLNKTLNMVEITTPEQELSIVEQVLSGLEYLHCDLRLAHCDIKENNIMVDFYNRIKIIDFNNCMPEESFGTFELGIVLAKKHKDLLINPKNWDWKVDFWALGCTLFQVKNKIDIIDEFLKSTRIDYSTLDTNRHDAKLQRIRVCLYNFYLQKIKEFKINNQLVYSCLKSSSCAKLRSYLKQYRDFHQLQDGPRP